MCKCVYVVVCGLTYIHTCALMWHALSGATVPSFNVIRVRHMFTAGLAVQQSQVSEIKMECETLIHIKNVADMYNY